MAPSASRLLNGYWRRMGGIGLTLAVLAALGAETTAAATVQPGINATDALVCVYDPAASATTPAVSARTDVLRAGSGPRTAPSSSMPSLRLRRAAKGAKELTAHSRHSRGIPRARQEVHDLSSGRSR